MTTLILIFLLIHHFRHIIDNRAYHKQRLHVGRGRTARLALPHREDWRDCHRHGVELRDEENFSRRGGIASAKESERREEVGGKHLVVARWW